MTETVSTGYTSTSGTETVTQTDQDTSVDLNDDKIYTAKHVKKIHEENAERRLKVKELEAKLQEIENEKAIAAAKKLEEDGEFKKLADEARKDAEKARKEAAAKIEAQQRKTIKNNAKALLIKEGIIDEDDVALLDLSKVQWDDDADEPTGLDDIVKAFKKSKPAKFKSSEISEEGSGAKGRAKTTTPSSATGGRSGKGDSAWNMSKDEFTSAWNTIRL